MAGLHSNATVDVRKDVSVGEYEAATGLTHITQQRGRLLFNMGANANKQNQRMNYLQPLTKLRTGQFTGLSLYPEEAYYLLQRQALVVYEMSLKSNYSAESSIVAADNGHVTDEGDETNVQGAPQERQPPLVPWTIAGFLSKVIQYQRVSIACLDAYAFLKSQKLHPRRHLMKTKDSTFSSSPSSLASESTCSEKIGSTDHTAGVCRPQPMHFVPNGPCQFAYDVWKSIAEIVQIEEQQTEDSQFIIEAHGNDCSLTKEKHTDHQAHLTDKGVTNDQLRVGALFEKMKKKKPKTRKVKRLVLVFRVIVCEYDTPPPRPAALFRALHDSVRQSLDGQNSSISGISDESKIDRVENQGVPVKLAVVDRDGSVLLFEIV